MDQNQEKQTILYEQLKQIFPNHEEYVIRKTVLNVSKHEDNLDHCLESCIEELVNTCPVKVYKKGSIKHNRKTSLSTLQSYVLGQLLQIFPNYDTKDIRTSVCNPSNATEPLTKQTLLQHCIDDILDSGTALKTNSEKEDDVKMNSGIGDDDVSITKVEASKDVMITATEEAMDTLLSDDEDELPSVAQVVELKTSPFAQQPVHYTVSIPPCSPTLPVSQCESGIPSQTKISTTSNKDKTLRTPVPALKPELKTGLSDATAHISLSEKDDELEYATLPFITKNVESLKHDTADERTTSTGLSDKQTCDHNSTTLMDTSFNVSKADMFSTRTLESGDSESGDSFGIATVSRAHTCGTSKLEFSDSDFSECLSDDDALPQIQFPKQLKLRDSFSNNNVLDSNSRSRQSRDTSVKLDNKFMSLETVGKSGKTESDSFLVTPGPSLGSSSCNSKGLQSNFKFSPPHFIIIPDSKKLPSHTFSMTQQEKTTHAQGHGQSEEMVALVQDSTHTSTQHSPVKSELHKGDWSPPSASANQHKGAWTPPSASANQHKGDWTPPSASANQCKGDWTLPSASANQQTVTIESTHKITYNNLVKGNTIGQSTSENNGDKQGAKPKYSMSAPNITFQVPLNQPNLEFVDKYSASSSTAAKDMLQNRGKHGASSAPISTGMGDYRYQNNSHVPPYIPGKMPVLRPPVFPRQGPWGSAGDGTNLTNPTVVNVVTTGDVPVPALKSIHKNPFASHTAPNPETKNNPTPIVIFDEPDDLYVRQPNPVHILVPDETAEGGHIAGPEPVQKIPDNPIMQVKNDVLNLFPDVESNHLDALCQQHVGPMAVNDICFILIEEKYPKKESKSTIAEKKERVHEVQTIDFYKDYKSVIIPEEMVVKYQAQAFQTLAQEFVWLSANDIKAVMRKVGYYYAPSYRALQTVWRQAVEVAQKKVTEQQSWLIFRGLTYQAQIPADEGGGMESRLSVKLLKNRRPVIKTNFETIPELQREINFVNQKLKDTELEADRQVAVAMNEQDYEDQGQCIECGCCYGEYPFEQMVQCCDGHLFCENCLRQYAKESVFGQGKADLKCMTDLCDSAFPKSQLMKALPAEIFEKYEDRVTEENLNLADLGDLIKCPHCDFRAFMDPDDRVFRCQSDHCQKETCRYCQVDWEEHFGKRCSEVEKKDETQIRLAYEEKMTKAKVRVCHRCKAQFMKSDGCNKMTCRCGGKMCYICRQPNIDYNHFCRHPRDPGKDCTTCKACNLWTNPEEDDNRAIAEMQKEAEEERKKQGYTDAKIIGVPDQPPAKKVKR